MSSIRQERRKRFHEARNKFAKLELKPYILDNIALGKRIELNLSDVFHLAQSPFSEEIGSWKLSEEFLTPSEIQEDKLFFFVQDNESLLLMREHLLSQKVIAVDCEFAQDHTYHAINALIQISTPTRDFVVDSLKCYNLIYDTLNAVFLNSQILKIVFGTEDVRSLQRDFNLQFFPLIDFQNVLQELNWSDKPPNFKDVVMELFSVDINKEFQFFDYQLRPLPQNVISYAIGDSAYLLRAWNELISENDFTGDRITYQSHYDLMLLKYKFPAVDSEDVTFNKAWNSLKDYNLRNNYTGIARKIFSKIRTWRENTARLTDKKPKFIISNLELLKLSILQPKEINELNDIGPTLCQLNMKAKQSILFHISRLSEPEVCHEISPDTSASVSLENTTEAMDTSQFEQESYPGETDQEAGLTFNLDEFLLENNDNDTLEIPIEQPCIFCEKGLSCKFCEKKNNLYSPVAYGSDGTRYSLYDYNKGLVKERKLINFFRKKAKNINRLYINEHRVKHGLVPLHFRKNRGVKAREKAKLFRELKQN